LVHWLILITIMILSGLLGGFVNYFFNGYKKTKIQNIYEILKSTSAGVAAALLVPLFLNMISSNLIKESQDDVYKLFILTGFCLIASISSKKFIQSISDKILDEVKTVKDRVSDVEKELDPIIEKETEDDSKTFHEESFLKSSSHEPFREFDEDDIPTIKVLKSLSQSKFTFRTLSGIGKDIGFEPPIINDIMTELMAEGFVDYKPRENGSKFYITKSGRAHLHKHRKTLHLESEKEEY
jgi:hypothetical protein